MSDRMDASTPVSPVRPVKSTLFRTKFMGRKQRQPYAFAPYGILIELDSFVSLSLSLGTSTGFRIVRRRRRWGPLTGKQPVMFAGIGGFATRPFPG